MASTLASDANTSNDRPLKRLKTDQDALGASKSQIPEVHITKSDIVWVPDGDLVIRTVEKDSEGPFVVHTLYRVHKAVLALHCGAFASMFQGEQAAFEVASERYEGVSVMELPDAAEDVKHFLDAMYHPKRLRRHQPEFGEVSLYEERWPEFPESYCGVLRLATKYDAQDMRQQVGTALAQLWPYDLDDWDAVEELATGFGPDYREPGKYIRLATANDMPEVLPAMFYDLARATDNALSEMELEDQEQYKADLDLLTPSELRRLILGKASLRVFVKGLTKRYKGESSACRGTCKRSPGCLETANSWWQNIVTLCAPTDCLKSLKLGKELAEMFGEKSVCNSRRRDVQRQIESIRQATWNALPQIFRISDDSSASAAAV
ncbi:hypothetical protein FA95DRAFT_1680108 [Auriscalpium vulgare]|uniref:Uncharacterized protein n=1 Tax=Auriscalpium vulgare TaxID=40419 RepID=A0ACB8RPM1_9AGAM|nr:hypothetical protein FA95DRAFT_1680108 [Auriscalpium vulgare]